MSSGLARTVDSDKTFADGSTVATGWVLSSASTALLLDVLSGAAHAGPENTLIVPAASDNKYDNANSSISGNGPHNPFLVGDVTFTLQIMGLTDQDSVNNVFFQFGTTDGANHVSGNHINVPDCGTTVALLGIALSSLGLVRRKLN